MLKIRHNKYSSVMDYYNFIYKLSFRDKEYSMLNDEQADDLLSTRKNIKHSNDSVIGKVLILFLIIIKEDSMFGLEMIN